MTVASKDPPDEFNPLETHRFQPGRSGNPQGRPRGSKSMKTIVQKTAHERHNVTENGRQRTLSTVELIITVIQRKALEGNLQAKKLVDALRDEFSPQEANSNGCGVLVVPEAATPETTPLKIEDVNQD